MIPNTPERLSCSLLCSVLLLLKLFDRTVHAAMYENPSFPSCHFALLRELLKGL